MRRKLIVGIDLDDVLIDLLGAWVNWLNKKHNLNVTYNDITNWDITKFFPTLTKEEIFEPLNTPEFWNYVKPLPNTVTTLKSMFEDDRLTVKIITASSYKTLQMKFDNVLFSYFPFLSYKDVIVCYDKHLIDVDVLIDDCVSNFTNFRGIGILIDMPHNKEIDPLTYDVRVKDLCTAYEIITELCNILR